MPTAVLAPSFLRQLFDNSGNPLAGGKLFTYASGTTTKQATYTDSSMATPNANPIVLDSAGRANVWLDSSKSYKFVLAPSTDADPPESPLWTLDGYTSPASTSLTRLYADAAVRGSVGSTETLLGNYTVPGGTLATDGQIIRVTWGGVTSAAVGVGRDYKIYVGGTLVSTHNTSAASATWRLSLELQRTGAGSQFAIVGFEPSANPYQSAAPTAVLANDVLIKLTGTGASDNDIVEKMMVVELLP